MNTYVWTCQCGKELRVVASDRHEAEECAKRDHAWRFVPDGAAPDRGVCSERCRWMLAQKISDEQAEASA